MLRNPFIPGNPVWLDLGAPDVDAAKSFYRSLFGWSFQQLGPETGDYGFFQNDGGTVAACGPLMGEDKPAWTLYFTVQDVDVATGTVEEAGGAVRVPPTDVFTAGRMAQCADPQGARFALWQPRDTVGVDAVGVPGTLCWTELYTTDDEAAKGFYQAVLGWDYRAVPIGEGVTYWVVRAAGAGEGGEQGGLMELPERNQQAGTNATWHPYFETADCDAVAAAVTAGGGTVLMPPTDHEGIGRFALLTDPFGAFFAAITSENLPS